MNERASSDMRPSQGERARAALTLAAIQLLRGRSKDAKKTLTKVRELMPRDDRQFSIDYVEALLAAGNIQTATEESRRARKRWPDDLGVRVAAADTSLKREEASDAVALLAADGVDISGNVRAFTARGRAYLALGEVKKAIADLDAALAIAPTATNALVARSDAYLRTGDAEMAVKQLRDVYSEDAPIEISILYAAALRQADDNKQARTILERLITQPGAGRAQLELARLERADARFARAEKAYAAAIEAFPDDAEVLLEAALLNLDTGEIKKTRDRLRTLVKNAAKNHRVVLETARVLILTGSFAEAEELLKDAEQLPAAPSWQIARERARMALKLNRVGQAAGYLQTVRADLDDQDEEIWLLLMEVQLRDDNVERARETKAAVYKKFSRGEPIRDMARARLAVYDGRIKDALDGYKKAMKNLKVKHGTPRQRAEVHYWTGRAYYQADRLQEARRALGKAIDDDPGHADAQFYRGYVDLSLKKWKSAEKALRASIDIDPTGTPEAYYHLAEVIYNQSRWGAAKKAFKDYIGRYPDGDFVPDARRFLNRRLR